MRKLKVRILPHLFLNPPHLKHRLSQPSCTIGGSLRESKEDRVYGCHKGLEFERRVVHEQEAG